MKTILCVVLVAGLAFAAAPAPKVDVTGKWNFAVETSAGSGSPKFDLKQDGENLTGTYEGQLGSAKLTGTVKGNNIEFKFAVDQVGNVTYSGTIQEDGTIKGKVTLGELGEGTFTGKRADK